jgi:regulatory protein
MDYAMRALSRRAHTTFELGEKLKKRATYSPQLGALVLARLTELKLLDDEAYVRRTIDQATRMKPQGRIKLASRLHQKGIDVKNTTAIWNTMDVPERDMALAALKSAEKRFARVPPEKLYQRRAQFLASRGFSPEIVFELAKSGPNS